MAREVTPCGASSSPVARRAGALLAASIVVGLVAGAPARADYVMGPPEVNAALKQIARGRAALQQGPAGRSRADTLFSLAADAEDLAALINQEIASHGYEQRALIDLAVERCAELGVRISFDTAARQYAYDRAALREYLAVQPRGPHAVQARYFVLERAFRQRSPTDGDALAELAREAGALRPLYAEASCELDYFAAMATLERSRLASRPRATAEALRSTATQLFERVSHECPDTPEATLAKRELARLAATGASSRRRQ